jgi:hypothetical protein
MPELSRSLFIELWQAAKSQQKFLYRAAQYAEQAQQQGG